MGGWLGRLWRLAAKRLQQRNRLTALWYACACRFVDPNDPSTIYLSQPVDESQRLSYQPVYAANYGKDEKPYEPMGLRP